MSDKLDWLNKHFVLHRYLTVKDAREEGKYKLRPDLEQHVTGPEMTSEDFVHALEESGKYKDACDYLAYIMHRRAAIWWGYLCLLSLNEELAVNPAVERDIADIGAPKEMPVPEWAKMPPDLIEKEKLADAEAKKQISELRKKLDDTVAQMRSQVSPEVLNLFDKMMGVVDQEFKRVHNCTLMELVQKAGEKSMEPLFKISENSPIIKAKEELKMKLEAQRKETIDLIKSVLPPKMPAHQAKMRDSAMQAIYRWIQAPDEVNSKKAFDIGNEVPDTPAGMMSLAAFWSFGNMSQDGKEVIRTPEGLAANGICSSLLQAALSKGGTRKYKERCQLYLDLGLEVVRGKNVWAEAAEQKQTPHEEVAEKTEKQKTSVPPPHPDSSDKKTGEQSVEYRKWKP